MLSVNKEVSIVTRQHLRLFKNAVKFVHNWYGGVDDEAEDVVIRFDNDYKRTRRPQVSQRNGEHYIIEPKCDKQSFYGPELTNCWMSEITHQLCLLGSIEILDQDQSLPIYVPPFTSKTLHDQKRYNLH